MVDTYEKDREVTREDVAKGALGGYIGSGALKAHIAKREEKELIRSASESDATPLEELQARFSALAEDLNRRGAKVNPLNPDMKRMHFSKGTLNEAQLHRLGFVPVRIAIPEGGQARTTSYRHPVTNHHIHDHGDRWIMHEDAHAAFPMENARERIRRSKGRRASAPTGDVVDLGDSVNIARRVAGGAAHLFTEGLLGGLNAIKGRLTGANMRDAVEQQLGVLDVTHDPLAHKLNKIRARYSAGMRRVTTPVLLGSGIVGATAAYNKIRKRASDNR